MPLLVLNWNLRIHWVFLDAAPCDGWCLCILGFYAVPFIFMHVRNTLPPAGFYVHGIVDISSLWNNDCFPMFTI